MNRKQILELVTDAIRYADQQDAHAEQTRPIRAQGDARRVERLTWLAISIEVSLERHAPGTRSLIGDFLNDVIYVKNPLLDAADSNEEKSE